MEEKELIRSRSVLSKAFIIIVAILLIASAVTAVISIRTSQKYYVQANDLHSAHEHSVVDANYYKQTGKMRIASRYMDDGWKDAESVYFSLLSSARNMRTLHYASAALLCVSILLLLVWLYSSKMEVIVTDRRVHGRAAFGKNVDLPLDKVSAVAQSAFHGLAVATSAGKVAFTGIKNRDDVYQTVISLLNERQIHREETDIKQEAPVSAAAELKQFKELLDSGIITQEEFDAKKKQLLGL